MAADFDIRRFLLKGGGFATVVAIQAITTVAVLPSAVNILGPRAFGQLAGATAIMNIVRAFGTLGLPAGLTMVYFNRLSWRERSRPLMVLATAAPLVLGALVTPFAFLALRTSVGLNPLVGMALGFVVASAVVSQTWSRNTERVWLYATGALTSGAIGQLVALAVVASTPLTGATAYMLVWGIVALLGTLVMVARPNLALPEVADFRGLRLALQLGLPSTVQAVSAALVVASDRPILSTVAAPEVVGYYYLSYTFGTVVIALLNGIAPAWSPFVLSKPIDVRRGALRQSLGVLLVLAAWASTCSALVGSFVLQHLIPPAHIGYSLFVVAALCSLALPATINIANQIWLYHSENSKAIAATGLAGAGASVGLNVILIPVWGPAGAAGATVASYTVVAAVGLYFARRSGGAGYIPFARVIRSALVLAVGTIGTLASPTLLVRIVLIMVVSGYTLWTVRQNGQSRLLF